MKNAFETFGMPIDFDVDLSLLDQHYFTLQAAVHPDRMIKATGPERLAAATTSAHLNGCYQTLKDPIKRAAEILRCRGLEVPGENGQTIQDPSLLMDVMAWQEALAEAKSDQAKQALAAHLSSDYDACCKTFMAEKDREQLTTHFLRLSYLHKTLNRLKQG